MIFLAIYNTIIKAMRTATPMVTLNLFQGLIFQGEGFGSTITNGNGDNNTDIEQML